ncbi:DUF3099 domain-containing protein [Actinomycetospora endophytica]|uniref:DUF3099 domain-containing protein n=1 Tax=Actinomycetospora endophytica TaxID=2291215 RepID=UPI0027E34C30|nr:DUF3099 domain-containing protein [Actinomycetospora endophytica]
MTRRHDDDPVLITEAQVSFDDEFSARKRRYSIIMLCRIPCLLLAGLFGIAFNMPLVAVLFIVLSVPLPWVAVLIANDRLPKKAGKVNHYRPNRKALPEVSEAQIIEAAESLDARSHRTDGPRQDRQDAPDHEPPHPEQAPPRTGTDG